MAPVPRSRIAAATALLGEQVRSELPGYRVFLHQHAAGPASAAMGPPVVIEIARHCLEVVMWVDGILPSPTAATEASIEVRVVLLGAEHGGAIAEIVGEAVTVMFGDFPEYQTAWEALRLADELVTELREMVQDDPALASAVLNALRVYDNDPFV